MSASDSGSSFEEEPARTWESYKEMGNAAFKAARYVDAVAQYTAAIELNNREPTLYSNRAAANLKLRQWADAARDSERAIDLDPLFVKAYARLHTAYCTQGKFEDARRRLESGISALQSSGSADAAQIKDLQATLRSTQEALTALAAAQQHIDKGENSLAQRVLAPVAQTFPDCASLIILRALSDAQSNPDKACESLAAIAHRHGDDANFLYARALAMYYSGQNGLANAQKLVREVLNQDPDNSKAQKLLKKIRALETAREAGNAAYKAKNYQEAIDRYTDAIQLDATNLRIVSVLRGNRAAAYMEIKNYDLARVDCDFAISNGNDGAKMYARRSRIYENLEKWDDAQRDMQQAAEREDAYRSELHSLKARAKRSKRKDYYKILGVDQGADDSVLKKAYKLAALKWHPDKWAHSTEEEKAVAETKFKEVGEAFGVLSDPQKRRRYDNGQIDNDVEGDHGGMGGGMGGMDMDMMQMFSMMFPGGMGGGMGGMPRGGSARGGRRQQAPPGFAFSFQ